MKIGDKVKSTKSLFYGDIGTVSGIIPIYAIQEDEEGDEYYTTNLKN